MRVKELIEVLRTRDLEANVVIDGIIIEGVTMPYVGNVIDNYHNKSFDRSEKGSETAVSFTRYEKTSNDTVTLVVI